MKRALRRMKRSTPVMFENTWFIIMKKNTPILRGGGKEGGTGGRKGEKEREGRERGRGRGEGERERGERGEGRERGERERGREGERERERGGREGRGREGAKRKREECSS